MSPERYVQVAVDAPLLNALTYKTSQTWPAGSSVRVPLGRRKANAVIVGEGDTASSDSVEFAIKEIEALDESRPQIPVQYMKWLSWVADYYVHPIGQVMALAFPPLDKKTSSRASKKSAVIKSVEIAKPPQLTTEQAKCIKDIQSTQGFHVHLLHGVTGSGKTEVYLRLLENTLARGGQGLVLVPEISLTPQLIQRFAARFGEKIAVLHSHLTDRERTNQWWSIVEGEKKILIGARSALFCPMPKLGLIIVDEEHEPSYKQEEKLRYHARDSAIVLAQMTKIPILLGSATPSLESWYNAQNKKYTLHTMASRVSDRHLPTVEVIDLRHAKEQKKENSRDDLPHWMSEDLHREIKETLAKNEQVALFLNRRGVAPTVLCPDCGYIYKCPNCEIALTLHGQHNLVCHYCDYAVAMKAVCPSCQIGEIKTLGLGTEQIELDIQRLFPDARVARADRDEIHSRESLEHLIESMESHTIDILVGTQMIAKGLDFPKLTLVGLVLADVGFNLPDFRSTERSFQLLTQVSGRSGRHIAHVGRVDVQTYNPDYPSIQFAKTANYDEFAQYELNQRQELLYPPFGKLAALRVVAQDKNKGAATIERLAHRAEVLISQHKPYEGIQILGPTEAPLAKLRGKYRYHLLLKTSSHNILSRFCRQLLGGESWIPSGTKVQVDIDPINLL